MQKLRSALGWALYSLGGLWLALTISWIMLAIFDFGYPILHDTLDIEQHSQKFGPQNQFKLDFEKTNKQERVQLFHAINIAIHRNGAGLEDIEYHTSSGDRIDTLLREAEVIHLQDVAHLINQLAVISLLIILLWGATTYYLTARKAVFPSLFNQALLTIAALGLSALVVILIGPTKVFYAFHHWVFPDNHQWFFYYQESLMTILMKAPDLFGWIAILLVVSSIIIFIVLNFGTRWITQIYYRRKHSGTSAPNISSAK